MQGSRRPGDTDTLGLVYMTVVAPDSFTIFDIQLQYYKYV